MDYIKLFDNHVDYETFRLSDEFKKPNLSYCENPGEVHFNQNDQFNNYDYVDLGLPSGTLWAKYNLGATNEYDVGSYFSWGETQPQDYYDYDYNKWYKNSYTCFYTDNATTLYLEDDAARVNMKGKWQIPSVEQGNELKQYTNKQTVNNYNNSGINGLLFTSSINGNSVFFPYGGFYDGNSLHNYNQEGFYQTNYIGDATRTCAFNIRVRSGSLDIDDSENRYYGLNIRAVISGENA